MFHKFEEILSKAETMLVCIGLMILIVTVFVAAVLRFVGIDMSWSTDLAQLVFAWVSFIGADLALRKDRHMGVDMLTNKFSVEVQNTIRLICYCLVVCFLVLAVRYGIDLCIVNPDRKYNTLYISYSFATASCPVGCGLMLITAVKRVAECVMRFVNKDFSYFEKEVEV